MGTGIAPRLAAAFFYHHARPCYTAPVKNPFKNIFNAGQNNDSVGAAPAPGIDDPAGEVGELENSIAEALRGNLSILEIAAAGNLSDRAATFAAAYRSVTLIAGSMAQLPGYIEAPDGYRVESPAEIKSTPDRHIAEMLLFDRAMISGMFTFPELIKQMAADMAITGNSFAEKIRSSDGTINEIEYLSPQYASGALHRRPDGRLFATYKLRRLGMGGNTANSKHTFSARDLVHCRMPSMLAIDNQRALLGSAPMSAIRRPLTLARYADEFRREYFQRGGFGNQAFVSFPDSKDGEEAMEVEQRIHRARAENAKRRAYTVVGGDAKVTPLTVDTQSAEMSRHAGDFVEEVARAFGIPGSLIGIKDTTRAAAGLEELTKIFIRFCLTLYRRAIEHAITYALFSQGYQFKFDTTAFTAADLSSMSTFIMATNGDDQRPGIMTPAELRAMIGDVPKIKPSDDPATSPGMTEKDDAK